MKIIQLVILTSFLSIAAVHADELSAITLNDVSYQFDQDKLKAADDSFHFLRTFVDYYYDLIPANKNNLHLSGSASSFSGWCAGDAHPENFGALLEENGSVLFSINDMDDAGPCPVAYDFLRLLVSSRLYSPKLDITKVISSYQQGLSGGVQGAPSQVQSLLKDAADGGEAVDPKDLDNSGKQLKRKKDSAEVDSSTRAIIVRDLQTFFTSKQFASDGIKVIDMLSTSKVGGGSGGLQRYEVLCTRSNGSLLHLELKELTNPAITQVATETIPDQKTRIMKTLEIEQGTNYSHYYSVTTVAGKTMLIRPKFSGNIGINLDKSLSGDDSLKIISYEAYVLGRIHAETVNQETYLQALNQLSASDWESDVSSFTKHFNKKFSELQK